MRAASWDIEWEVRGGWKVILQRRDRAGTPLPLADPCVMEIRRVDQPRTTPALKTLAGVLDTTDPASHKVTLTATVGDVLAVGAGRFEHVILVGDPTRNESVVLVDGFLRVRDRAGG